MTTRYEFGVGEGEIYRRRMRGQEEMHERAEEARRELPDEERRRSGYDSDYYGFRGAGRRSRYVEEYRVQRRSAGRRFARGGERPQR